MIATKYPNRDALYAAHTIYRDLMCSFIMRCLNKHPDATPEKLIRKVLISKHQNKHKDVTVEESIRKVVEESDGGIEAVIDINDFPEIIRKYWKWKCPDTRKVYNIFCKEFNSDGDIRSEIELIKNGRPHWAHPGLKDSNPEEVRTQLYHIIKVLDKINEPEAKHEVETIRNQLFSSDGQEHLVATKEPLAVLETEKAATEECSADISDELLDSETMKKCLEVCSEHEVGQFLTENVKKKYPLGSVVGGTVSHVADHAVFVKLEEDVEGRIPKAELFWGNSDVLPSRHFKQGGEIQVIVVDTSKEDKRISLSLKSLKPNPWELRERTHLIEQKYPIGTKITGPIRNKIDSGVFIEIEPGINGFLPTPMPELLSAYGEVEATIFEINAAERQISLVGYGR